MNLILAFSVPAVIVIVVGLLLSRRDKGLVARPDGKGGWRILEKGDRS